MAQRCIGVDVGGTKIYVGLINKDNGEIIDYVHFFRADMSSTMVLQKINKYISSFYQKYKHEFPVGIAVPELVDNKGLIQSDYNYDWIGQEKQFKGQKVTIESDVRAAAFAELSFGVAKKALSSLYISLGTGLSFCLIQEGKIWRGHQGNAIHFATSPLFFPNGNNDIFTQSPQAVSYEKIIAGKGFNKFLKEMTEENITSYDWIKRLKQKDEPSLWIAKIHAQYLGALLAQLINSLDPEQIIIGGGLGNALKDTPYMDFLKNETTKYIIAPNGKNIPFYGAKYKTFSALIGAGLSA